MHSTEYLSFIWFSYNSVDHRCPTIMFLQTIFNSIILLFDEKYFYSQNIWNIGTKDLPLHTKMRIKLGCIGLIGILIKNKTKTEKISFANGGPHKILVN